MHISLQQQPIYAIYPKVQQYTENKTSKLTTYKAHIVTKTVTIGEEYENKQVHSSKKL